MSLKADWDEADERLRSQCVVLAAWQGFRLARHGHGWNILPTEPIAIAGAHGRQQRGQPEPVIAGLTLDEVADWLSSPSPRVTRA